MKRLLIALLLLLAAPAWAGEPMQLARMSGPMLGAGGSAAATPYCSTCPDVYGNGDVACEIPDGNAGGLCTWTAIDGGSECTISAAATPDNSPVLGCTDIGMTYVMSFAKTTAGTGACGFTLDIADLSSLAYVQAYVKISAESLADDGIYPLILLTQAAGSNMSIGIYLTQVSTKLYFALRYHSGGTFVLDVGGTEVALDTWYGLRFSVNKTDTDSLIWYVDYTNNGNWTDETGGSPISAELDRAIRYAAVGAPYVVAEGASFYATGVKIDDDTMPSACIR